MTTKATLAPDELLERIALSLKEEIGPAVSVAYPKTQAFMASVVLQKLACELRHAAPHAEQNRSETQALVDELDRMLAARDAMPAVLAQALSALRRDLDTPALTQCVEALYETRAQLGDELFDALLARTRRLLRARVDRAMVVAK